MKIWSWCLCFGFGVYVAYRVVKTRMNEKVGNDKMDGIVEIEANMADASENVGEREGGVGSSNVAAVVLNVGSCSSFSPFEGDEIEEKNHDSPKKRAKVHSDLMDWNQFSAPVSSDAEMCRFLQTDSNNDDCYNNSGIDENSFNFMVVRSEAGSSGTPRMEDLEVRMDLTDDLLHMVFSFLKHMDLCRASMVCKQWQAASTHEDFWRILNFENRNISIEQFGDLCRRYPNATELNLCGSPLQALVVNEVLSLRNLEAVTLGKGLVGEYFFETITDCHLLKNMVISDATLGIGGQEIFISHDGLKHLHIMKCRVLRISIRCPLLETLSLKRSSMAHAVLNCPILRDLDIASCHRLSDPAIRSAATSCPLLESLDMLNCSCVTDETLQNIADTCVNLHVLNASYCPNVSLESVRLNMLTSLKLHSCEGITTGSISAISRSSLLEVLELDNCSLLASVSLDLSRLQSIRLVHCRKFVDLNLRCPMLTSITLSNCPLQRINIISRSLEKLVLQKQESLTALALQCQRLQEVDLTDCESITDSICQVFSDVGGCPMLKTLVLDNCESLTNVGFSSSTISSISLAGCHGVTSLELKCPYLEKVSLDGCDHLEKASFSPVGLQFLNLGICPKLKVLHIEAPVMILLELKGCGVLSEAYINCPLLTCLDASFCSQLKDDCLSATTALCPLIESLILMSCPSVGHDGLSSLRWLPRLTSLDLSYTFLTNLQPVFETCIQLQTLKLQACKYLDDSALEPLYKEGALPALSELDLSYGTLCQLAIEELLTCCTNLTHVSLNGCTNMHDLDWSFSDKLQNLNCVGCPNIKEVSIPPPATCFNLLSLNLSLSANLREVDLACLNLCLLNLSNCSALESLKLDCPKLSSLFLQSCNMDGDAVEAAISECSMLETLDVRFAPKICPVSIGKLRAACPSLKRIYNSLSPS